MSRYFSFITLLVVIGLLVVLFFRVMAGFFVPLFLAALLVVVFRPLHLWMVDRCQPRLKLAAFLTTSTIMLCVLVPLSMLFLLAAFESQQLLKQINKTSILTSIEKTRQQLNLTLPPISEDLRTIELRLDNIAELERLEDIVYLSDQLDNTAYYNRDLEDKLESNPAAKERWQLYIDSFQQLRNIQEKIANPLLVETADTDSESNTADQKQDTGQLVHDFQQTLLETRDLYSEFKIEALGGSAFWVWLREFANPSQELLEQYGTGVFGYTRNYLLGLGATTTAFLVKLIFGIVILVISLFFFLLDGPRMIESVKALLPIDDEYEQELIDEFGRVSRAVVVATLVAALVQAVLGGIGYYFAGLESVFLLTLLTGCMALVPFFGAASVWVTCVGWLFFVDNNLPAAIGLTLWGVVISLSDNYVKPLVLHGQSNIHPLLALLSILGGIGVLGPIGLLIGPMIVAFLQTLLKILQREIVDWDEPDKTSGQTA